MRKYLMRLAPNFAFLFPSRLIQADKENISSPERGPTTVECPVTTVHEQRLF